MRVINCDCIFPGAVIKKDALNYTVIKVNKKSFYASEMTWKKYCDEYQRFHTTFKEFCKAYNIQQYKFDGSFDISDNELKRKPTADVNVASKYKMDRHLSSAIDQCVEELNKKKRKIKLVQFSYGKNLVRFLEERDGCFMLNIDGDYIMYSSSENESIKIGTVYDYCKNYDHVPWEKLSKFSTV